LVQIKNVAVISSSRADFNYFRLILKKIIESKYLKLSLIITGNHLLENYGMTKNLIQKEKIPLTKIIEMYDQNDSSILALGRAIGRAIIKFTEAFNELKPDILLVLGDRFEALAAVIAASTFLIPIAHIHGGDNVSQGQIDEQIRHSITKFSHIHFPATVKSAERIKLLGEEEWRIHMVGSPSIDYLLCEKFFNKKEICEKLSLDPTQNIAICLQHPYTIEPDKSGEYMKETLKALSDLNLQSVIIYPNNDPGNQLIINEINQYNKNPNFHIFKNLDYFDYYSLLKNSDLMIGNSSGGIIESPIFKLPVINIGDRNRGRESANNIINVRNDYDEIKSAIINALSNDTKKKCQKIINPYGDGKASDRIVKVLENLDINKKLLIKKLTYNV